MKRPWIFYLLVLALCIYFWVPMLLLVLEVGHEPEPDLVSATEKPAGTKRPLDEHNIIAERNLFGAPQDKSSAPSEEKEALLLKEIPLAEKDLGLILIGTVLAEDPKMNIAIIDNRSTQLQESYHEGDRIGEVLVKRILWDKVVIETERGEELLVMLFEGTAGGSSSAGVGLPDSSSSSSEEAFSPSFESEGSESSLTDLGPTVSSGPLYDFSSEGSSSSSLTDLEPTVSSGPL
jgi:type II secretory pathway component PulC